MEDLQGINPKQAVLLKPVDLAPTAGTVVALAGEAGRYTRFSVCMQSLSFHVPPQTAFRWMLGADIAESRNQACGELHGDWIWFIDDDHAFQHDIVLQLLARNVDIVQPVCLRRNQPFLPVAAVDGDYMDIRKYGPDELVEVEHAGSSGMLIRRRVLERLEQPWFELGHREGDGNRVSEDVNFCRKAKEAGFKIHVDMAVRLGHIAPVTIWPAWEDEGAGPDGEGGRWLTGFSISDGAELYIPPAEIARSEERVGASPS